MLIVLNGYAIEDDIPGVVLIVEADSPEQLSSDLEGVKTLDGVTRRLKARGYTVHKAPVVGWDYYDGPTIVRRV